MIPVILFGAAVVAGAAGAAGAAVLAGRKDDVRHDLRGRVGPARQLHVDAGSIWYEGNVQRRGRSDGSVTAKVPVRFKVKGTTYKRIARSDSDYGGEWVRVNNVEYRLTDGGHPAPLDAHGRPYTPRIDGFGTVAVALGAKRKEKIAFEVFAPRPPRWFGVWATSPLEARKAARKHWGINRLPTGTFVDRSTKVDFGGKREWVAFTEDGVRFYLRVKPGQDADQIVRWYKWQHARHGSPSRVTLNLNPPAGGHRLDNHFPKHYRAPGFGAGHPNALKGWHRTRSIVGPVYHRQRRGYDYRIRSTGDARVQLTVTSKATKNVNSRQYGTYAVPLVRHRWDFNRPGEAADFANKITFGSR